MSSMVRKTLIAAALASSVFLPLSAHAQSDQGRASMVAGQYGGQMAYAVTRWEQLAASPNFSFDEYSGFLLTYPGFPDEDKLRRQAEDRLATDYVAADRLI